MVLAHPFLVKTAFILSSSPNSRITESNVSSSGIGSTNPDRQFNEPIAPAVSPTAALPIDPEHIMHSGEEFSRDLDQSQFGPIHFCFIVHGHKGHAQDLWFLHQSICDKAKEHKAFSQVGSSENCSVGANLNSVKTNERKINKESLPQKLKSKLSSKNTKGADGKDSTTDSTVRDSVSLRNQASSDDIDIPQNSDLLARGASFLVCNPKCNEEVTDDGVEEGGIRLADEIIENIYHAVDKKRRLLGDNDFLDESPVDVTISLIGNSLGGLYARYAIARLAEMSDTIIGEGNRDKEGTRETRDLYLIATGKTHIRLHFNIFCTTATPHLGCADHTYIPIPRIFEKGMGHALGETGRDLFRLNGLLLEMATSPRFTEPLSR